MAIETNNAAELVRRAETDYNSGSTLISKYVDFDLAENINKIDAYLNSKHISGSQDSMGREKPFFNICTAATNIWYRATDIDRKNIKVKATKESDIWAAFIATHMLQDWMRRQRFGTFLNEWGRVLSRYGSAVVKFIETDGKLHAMVVPWNRLIIDAVDMDNDIVIEVLEYTPAQLRRKKGYDQEMVEQLIDTQASRQTLQKNNKDTKAQFIKVYEVHGEMPLSFITGKEEDEDEYVQQMQVISYVAKDDDKEYDDFVLAKGREKNPYMMTHLIKEDGRSQSIGAVENLFEAQWMVNHTQKAIKDQLDLASKLIFQTSDGNYVGQNALNSIEQGDILIHQPNQPLTQIANNSHDVVSLANLGQSWQNLGNEVNGISESMMGNSAPSGTAWRQVEALLAESHSLFELMTENKGLAIEDMMREYIIPHLKKKFDTSDEITAVLEQYHLEKVDKAYVPYQATKQLAKKIIKQITETGEVPKLDGSEIQAEKDSIVEKLNQQGNQRFFKPSEISDKTWKEILKDIEWDLEIDITGEQRDNMSDMATLSTVFSTVAGLNGQPMSKDAKLLFNKILERTGTVSPLELADASEAQQPPQQPQLAAPSGGQVDANLGGLQAQQ